MPPERPIQNLAEPVLPAIVAAAADNRTPAQARLAFIGFRRPFPRCEASCRRIEIGDQQVIFERTCGDMDRAVGIGEHRSAVIDHRILAADEIDIGQGDAGLGHPHRQQLVAPRVLAVLERRGIRHDHDFGTVGDRIGQWLGKPEILADDDANLDGVDLDNTRSAIGIDLEISALVEHGIVRQLAFAISRLDMTAAQHADRVVDDRAGRLWPSHHRDDPVHIGSQRLHRGFACGQETWTQQQILGRIAAEGEFGENDEVGAMPVTRFRDQRGDALRVVSDGTNGEVELGEGDADCRHVPSSVVGGRWCSGESQAHCRRSVASQWTAFTSMHPPACIVRIMPSTRRSSAAKPGSRIAYQAEADIVVAAFGGVHPLCGQAHLRTILPGCPKHGATFAGAGAAGLA